MLVSNDPVKYLCNDDIEVQGGIPDFEPIVEQWFDEEETLEEERNEIRTKIASFKSSLKTTKDTNAKTRIQDNIDELNRDLEALNHDTLITVPDGLNPIHIF